MRPPWNLRSSHGVRMCFSRLLPVPVCSYSPCHQSSNSPVAHWPRKMRIRRTEPPSRLKTRDENSYLEPTPVCVSSTFHGLRVHRLAPSKLVKHQAAGPCLLGRLPLYTPPPASLCVLHTTRADVSTRLYPLLLTYSLKASRFLSPWLSRDLFVPVPSPPRYR